MVKSSPYEFRRNRRNDGELVTRKYTKGHQYKAIRVIHNLTSSSMHLTDGRVSEECMLSYNTTDAAPLSSSLNVHT